MVPALVGVPSPQKIVAVKSAAVAAGLLSVKVATVLLKAKPSVAEKGTAETMIVVALACLTAAASKTPARAIVIAIRRPSFLMPSPSRNWKLAGDDTSRRLELESGHPSTPATAPGF